VFIQIDFLRRQKIMALITDPTTPTTISLVLRDENAREIVKEFQVPTAVWDVSADSIGALTTIRNTLVTALNAITNGLVYRAFITIKQVDDTLELGVAGSDLSDAASLVLNLETAGKKAGYILPAPVIGVFAGATGKNRNLVDVADGDLLTFTELFSTTDGSFTLSDGEQVTDTSAEQVASGKRISRKIKAPV
jgi:hypothetical protein